MADAYMEELGREFERLRRQKISDQQVKEYIELLLPVEKDASPVSVRNVRKLRDNMAARYFDAPDLKGVGKNAYRFINAVSDFATHADPIRRTKNYQENLFMKTYEGNPMIDKAYQLVLAA
jgi:polynucleotide 5'-kinase involved in rRNA processing